MLDIISSTLLLIYVIVIIFSKIGLIYEEKRELHHMGTKEFSNLLKNEEVMYKTKVIYNLSFFHSLPPEPLSLAITKNKLILGLKKPLKIPFKNILSVKLIDFRIKIILKNGQKFTVFYAPKIPMKFNFGWGVRLTEGTKNRELYKKLSSLIKYKNLNK